MKGRAIAHAAGASTKEFDSQRSDSISADLSNCPLAARDHLRFIRLLCAHGTEIIRRELDKRFA